MKLSERIEALAGELRAPTFLAAAQFILECGPRFSIIETGSYRGGDSDGESTIILALLANISNASFESFELHQHNIDKAMIYLKKHGVGGNIEFTCGDSAETLKAIDRPITFAYLDSYDFETHKAPDAQNHQRKEVEILLPKMAQKSAFLLDDCDLPLGGKGALSIPLILNAGYKETDTGYQRLFIRQ